MESCCIWQKATNAVTQYIDVQQNEIYTPQFCTDNQLHAATILASGCHACIQLCADNQLPYWLAVVIYLANVAANYKCCSKGGIMTII
jgi:hypothetical protein